MYRLLVKLMALTALLELGMSAADFEHCHSRACLQQIERRSRDILKVDWRPISVFPDMAPPKITRATRGNPPRRN